MSTPNTPETNRRQLIKGIGITTAFGIVTGAGAAGTLRNRGEENAPSVEAGNGFTSAFSKYRGQKPFPRPRR